MVFSVKPKALNVEVICWRNWFIKLGSAVGQPGTELNRKSNDLPFPKFNEKGVFGKIVEFGTLLGDLWSMTPLVPTALGFIEAKGDPVGLGFATRPWKRAKFRPHLNFPAKMKCNFSLKLTLQLVKFRYKWSLDCLNGWHFFKSQFFWTDFNHIWIFPPKWHANFY